MSDDITSEAQTIAVDQLRAFIERIERLEEEKKRSVMISRMFTLS